MTRTFIVMTASAKMPADCWGKYGRVAVVELEPGFTGSPKMISTHARGVKRIVTTWEKQFIGSSDRCAFERSCRQAQELADELNAR
jgi:hypothetical protein